MSGACVCQGTRVGAYVDVWGACVQVCVYVCVDDGCVSILTLCRVCVWRWERACLIYQVHGVISQV
jgi:hypothetical protein